MSELSVFDMVETMGCGEGMLSKRAQAYKVSRDDETQIKHAIEETGIMDLDLSTLEIHDIGGFLFHGSDRAFDVIKTGEELYNEGIGVNCLHVGGWCNSISLTWSLDVAIRFGEMIYVYEAYGKAVFIPQVWDAVHLRYVVPVLQEMGIDFVFIGNREREVVCINRTKLDKILMIPSKRLEDPQWLFNLLSDQFGLDSAILFDCEEFEEFFYD